MFIVQNRLPFGGLFCFKKHPYLQNTLSDKLSAQMDVGHQLSLSIKKTIP